MLYNVLNSTEKNRLYLNASILFCKLLNHSLIIFCFDNSLEVNILCFSERISTYTFLYSVKNPLPQAYAATPYRWLPHTEFMVGSKIYMPGSSPRQQSGYQVLRLATELVPSTLALIGANRLSPFWSVLFYFVLILFGISQQVQITKISVCFLLNTNKFFLL